MTFRRGSVSNWRAIFPCTLILSLTACVPSGSGSGSNVNVKANEWTWMSGSNTTGAVGVYGTQGAASAGNGPGSRASAVSWTDSSNNFWLFGGVDSGAAGLNNDFNDLWEFNPTSKQWTWVSGSQNANASGVYGTMGTPAASNVPGARNSSVSWTDLKGNFWLFGGYGSDSTGAQGGLNDLWEFNQTSKQWTWVSGSQNANALGVYGTIGTPSASNVPGARNSSVSWMDLSGNFWLFGGTGFDSTGANGYLNDLWEFNPTSKQWTWVSGSQSVNALGIYGTLGTTAAGNVPGARSYSVSWRDASNNLWLFGGYDGGSGDSTGAQGYFNDLWEFNPTSKEWTWVGGSNTKGAVAIYGTLNVTSASNVPGARLGSVSWIDTGHNNLWLFGGMGIGPAAGTTGYLNDLWWYQQ